MPAGFRGILKYTFVTVDAVAVVPTTFFAVEAGALFAPGLARNDSEQKGIYQAARAWSPGLQKASAWTPGSDDSAREPA